MEIYEVTVRSGESIKKVVSDYILRQGWESVYLTGAIGSVIGCEFTFPAENKLPLKIGTVAEHDAAELVSFVGEVMKREKMDLALENVYKDKTSPLFIHIHASVAAAGGRVIGGGLTDGKAFRAVRVFMTPLMV